MFLSTLTFVRAAFFTTLLLAAWAITMPQSVEAATTCTFTTSGSTMTLDADCTTDETLFIPDGMTLDGAGHTITGVDPSGGHFTGAVVANAGTTANVMHLNVTVDALANVCDGGANRLRGILFEGASGRIAHNTVTGIHQGPSGCQEGNAIEVRNAPFDGTHPNTQAVEIDHNRVVDYQKTGVVANGDVAVDVHHNEIGASATQHNLAANSLQLGFGATGSATSNRIDGNQWKGTSDYAATAILNYATDSVDVSNNNIRGNSDIGIYGYGSNATYVNNRVFDEGPDHPNSGYDIGLGNWDSSSTASNNKVRGFDVPYDGAVEDDNKIIPSPHQ